MLIPEKNVSYKSHPRYIRFSIPRDEVQLPTNLPFPTEIHDSAKYVSHLLYFGGQTEGPRKIWEQRRPVVEPQGIILRGEDYLGELAEHGAAPPPEDAWSEPTVIWVRGAKRILAGVSESDNQRRVTMVRGNFPPNTGSYESFRGGNKLSDRLTELGFGENDFDYLRTTGALRDATDVPRALQPITTSIDIAFAPLQYLKNTLSSHGRLITTTRVVHPR